jgi:hypothetical protein
MKTLYRNFLSIFRRFPASIVMNVVGLALALAAFIIIMMETYYEQTYNSSLKNIDRIFFLYEQREGSVPSSLIARPDIEHFKTISPDIVHSVYYEPAWWLAQPLIMKFTLKRCRPEWNPVSFPCSVSTGLTATRRLSTTSFTYTSPKAWRSNISTGPTWWEPS